MYYGEFKEHYCEKCIHYQHENHNVNNQYTCDFPRWDCQSDYFLTTKNAPPKKFEQVEDLETRKKELDQYKNYIREKNMIEDFWVSILTIVTYIIILLFIADAIFLGIYDFHMWFTNDNLTKMQLIKLSWNRHPILNAYLFFYVAYWFIIIKILDKK